MKVILLERIGKLGSMGDTVNVKDGYARNHLLPSGKALRANAANLAKFEADRAMLEARNAERKSAAEGVGAKMAGLQLVMIRSAGETGQLYGSVSTRDIAADLEAQGFTVARNQVALRAPIKTIGMHDVLVTLHGEVAVDIQVNVARSEDEASRQAAGEDLTGRNAYLDDEDDAPEAEEVFEEGTEELEEAQAETSEEEGSDEE